MNRFGMNQPPNFNRLARLYRWMEWFTFGPWLALTRHTFLDKVTNSGRALVVGDGDGRFTARLLRENPTIYIDAVDASAAMLDTLLHRAGTDANRVRVHLADVRTWQPPAPILGQPYDLIATHFFLDCLTQTEVQALAARLRNAASPSALWVISEFAVPPGWFGYWIARPLVSTLYFCFRCFTGLTVRTLPDHASALHQAGFALQEARFRLGGLLIGEVWAAHPAGFMRPNSCTENG
jgi:SAM-dependent methyltransferase